MLEMNEQLARQILGETIQADGSLFSNVQYIAWKPGDDTIVLDAFDFKVEQVVAIAWWINNKQ